MATLTNSQMKSDRFGRWARARKLVARIQTHLQADGRVVIATSTKAIVFSRKHAEMFKANRTGAYVARGKGWDCIDYCAFRFCD